MLCRSERPYGRWKNYTAEFQCVENHWCLYILKEGLDQLIGSQSICKKTERHGVGA